MGRMTRDGYLFQGAVMDQLMGDLQAGNTWASCRWGEPGELILIIDAATIANIADPQNLPGFQARAEGLGLKAVGATDQDTGDVYILYRAQ